MFALSFHGSFVTNSNATGADTGACRRPRRDPATIDVFVSRSRP